MDETQTLAFLAFFDGRPEEAALARALLGGILSALPETQVQVQKTQITLKHRHVFAALSLPRRSRDRKDHKLTLTLGLAHRLDSPPGGHRHRTLPRPLDPPPPRLHPRGSGRPAPGLAAGSLCLCPIQTMTKGGIP